MDQVGAAESPQTPQTGPVDISAEPKADDAPALARARAEADRLLSEIRGRADQARASVEVCDSTRAQAESAAGGVTRLREQVEQTLRSVNEQVAFLQRAAEQIQSAGAQVTSVLATAQSTGSSIAETAAQAASQLESIRSQSKAATDAAALVEGLKATVEQSAQVAAQRSKHIEDGRVYVDEQRATIDKLVVEARQAAAAAVESQQSARAVLDRFNQVYADLQATKAGSDAAAASVNAHLTAAEKDAATTAKLAEVADTVELRVKSYEAKLADLQGLADERLRKIDSLLPGAASAGLASAFNARRAHFVMPRRVWQGTFVACIVLLLGLAVYEFGFVSRANSEPTWERLSLSLLHRLPFALPLIWLAFHASHMAALAQRVEEDYAFKEAVSRSFEGYRRELADLEGKAGSGSPLARFCSGVLGVVTNPPGRIYDKHKLNHTPFNVIAETTGPIAEAVGKMAPRVPGT